MTSWIFRLISTLAVLFLAVASAATTTGSSTQKHIQSVGIESPSGGCKNGNGDHIVFGGALCPSKKPLKPKGVLQLGKSLCSPGWRICSHKDKQVQRLSWQKTPSGCYAFKYNEQKKKAAGYGTTCHTNLYFDGVLCCAVDHNRNLKKRHHLKLNKV